MGIPLRIVLFFIRVITEFTIFLVGLSGKLLNWVLSPNFIAFSYTKPGPAAPLNPIIETGLGITQGFVNMLLVLVLVYIAIATILRLQEYQAQKLLPIFIVVALLVNFAPVICGLIVDASNIIMNFFVQDLGADAFGEKMGNQVTQIMSGFDWTSLKWEAAGKRVLQLYIMNGFLFVLTFILGIFTLIFTLRYLVIWLLVILSPLAFVAYILPSTRPYFEKWWQQFLAWTFIGVSCGFFLYLGLLMVSYVPTAIPAPTTGQGGLFDPILPYFVSAVFLGIGLVFGLQTSAIGAGTAISLAKRGQNIALKKSWQATKWTGRKGLQGIQLARENLAKTNAGQKVQAWAQRQLARKPYGEGEAGFSGITKRAASQINPVRYFTRGVARVAGGKLPESQRVSIQKAEDSVKEVKEISVLLKKFHDALTDTSRIGILNQIIEKGKIKDAMDVEKFGKSAVDEKEISRLTKHAKTWGADKKLKTTFPHIAAQFVTENELAKAKAKDERINTKEKFILSKLKPEDYKNIPEKALENEKVVDAILSTAMGKHINQLIEQHGRTAARALEKEIPYRAYAAKKSPEDWLKDTNPRLHSYFSSMAGAGLVTIPKESLTKVEFEMEQLRRIGEKTRKERKKSPPPPSGRRAGGAGTAPSGRRP